MDKQVTFTFRMPEPVRQVAASAAAKDRVSLNAWLLRLIDAELAKREQLVAQREAQTAQA